MWQKFTRKPFKIGGTKAITLPKAWLDYYGDQCNELIILGNDILIIAPPALEEKAQNIINGLGN